MAFFASSSTSAAAATWIAVAPHEAAHGEWRFFKPAGGDAVGHVQGPLSEVGTGVLAGASTVIHVIAPLTRCVVMAVDMPVLQGMKQQQALAGVLGDRLSGGAPQHYAAGPIDNERLHEAAACDAAWLKQCLDACKGAGLTVARLIPEASLLPKGAAWWGQLQAGQAPAWLVRTANGEAVRVAPALLKATLDTVASGTGESMQWFADPACQPAPEPGPGNLREMSVAALAQRAVQSSWDIQQFAFAPPDRATRILNFCADVLQRRSGRFAVGAVLALLLINVLGLNLYALKQKREIQARQTEMERIVTQALPGTPLLFEPSLQLQTAWERTRNIGNSGSQSTASLLLGHFAQMGTAQALIELEISERNLRATFTDSSALERQWSACQSAALSARLRRAGVRCTREDGRLLMEMAGDAPQQPNRVSGKKG